MIEDRPVKKEIKKLEKKRKQDQGHLLTLEQFQRCLPTKSKSVVTPELLADINDLIENSPLRETFRDNLLSYTRVLGQGSFRIGDYVNAVKYVSFKLMGDTNIEAYTKTFPQRYQEMLNKEYDGKTIAAHVTGFSKSKLVTLLLEQSMVPSWIINQDLYQRALNTQADLMLNAKSEKVRTDAANSLLTQLKMPEVAKVQLDVNVKEDDTINELRRSTLELVKQQKAMIESGVMSAGEIAQREITVIEGEYSEPD